MKPIILNEPKDLGEFDVLVEKYPFLAPFERAGAADQEISVDHYPTVATNGKIIWANNEFDLHEANTVEEIINLKEVSVLSLMGGTFVTIYEKIDDTAPAAIFTGNDEEGFLILLIL